MSAKSIGYSAIALKNGVYTSASIGVNSKGQITQLISNTISAEGEDLQEGYDELVAIVADSVALETQIQSELVDISSSKLPLLIEKQTELTADVNDLQAQYDALEAQYQTLNIRFTPTLAYSSTPQTLPSFPTGGFGPPPTTFDTFTLPAGTYTWFVNSYATMFYIPKDSEYVPKTNLSPAQVYNPLDSSTAPSIEGIDGDEFYFNWAGQAVQLTSGGQTISVIACYDNTDISQPNSGVGLASKIDNAAVIGGSSTFVLSNTTTIEAKIYFYNQNCWDSTYTPDQKQIINQLEENVVFTMPVLQIGEMLEVWKVAN
jgi:hypothetical protein